MFSLFHIEVCVLTLFTIVPLLGMISYYTLAERKVMAVVQRRKGPNVVGWAGLLQPFADGIKLMFKEVIVPTKAVKSLFILAPLFAFFLSLCNWLILPTVVNDVIYDMPYGILYIMIFSSLNIYTIILSGWASASRYPILGALRAAAQMLSYELTLSLCLVCVVLLSGSLNLIDIVFAQANAKVYFVFPLLPVFIIFFIAALAETNRIPFDLPEAEAELVAGYNTEYSSLIFALFSLTEYNNALFMSALVVILFFGGWFDFFFLSWSAVFFILKAVLIAYLFILIRAALPRLRYDQLLVVGWVKLLPCILVFLFIESFLLIFFNSYKFEKYFPITYRLFSDLAVFEFMEPTEKLEYAPRRPIHMNCPAFWFLFWRGPFFYIYSTEKETLLTSFAVRGSWVVNSYGFSLSPVFDSFLVENILWPHHISCNSFHLFTPLVYHPMNSWGYTLPTSGYPFQTSGQPRAPFIKNVNIFFKY